MQHAGETMTLTTYKAILRGNRLEWLDEIPVEASAEAAIPVHITILQAEDAPNGGESAGQRMAAALEQIATLDEAGSIADPLQWEREIRRDRSLPNR